VFVIVLVLSLLFVSSLRSLATRTLLFFCFPLWKRCCGCVAGLIVLGAWFSGPLSSGVLSMPTGPGSGVFTPTLAGLVVGSGGGAGVESGGPSTSGGGASESPQSSSATDDSRFDGGGGGGSSTDGSVPSLLLSLSLSLFSLSLSLSLYHTHTLSPQLSR
jgi:hypothetical protein